jgi:parallel beta-helix repeat protein
VRSQGVPRGRIVVDTLITLLLIAVLPSAAGAGSADLVESQPAGVVRAGIQWPTMCGPTNCIPNAGPRRGTPCPPDAIRLRPRSRLQAAIDARPEGTTFCLEKGTYRLRRPLLPKSGNVFVGRFGTVLTGSKVVTHWRRRSGYWVANQQTQQGAIVAGVGCTVGDVCNRPESVFIDGKQLTQVARLSAVRPGRFYFDYASDRIYVRGDPRGRQVEASVASAAFRATDHYARDVVIENLRLRRFANPSRTGVIYNSNSPGWVVAYTEISANHGVGIILADGARIHHNEIHHNGQLALGGYRSEDVVVEANEMFANGRGGFTGWEAGAVKYVSTSDVLLRGNYVHHNRYHGLWMDTDTVRTRYIANTVVANKGSGIFHEVSFGAIIRGNYVARNRSDGIFISSSSGADIFENRVVGNVPWGIHLFIDGASGYDLANNDIHDNVVRLRSATYVGLSTMNVSHASPYSTSKGNRFGNNSYHVPLLREPYWIWDGGNISWREWRAAGQDVAGTIQPR